MAGLPSHFPMKFVWFLKSTQYMLKKEITGNVVFSPALLLFSLRDPAGCARVQSRGEWEVPSNFLRFSKKNPAGREKEENMCESRCFFPIDSRIKVSTALASLFLCTFQAFQQNAGKLTP